jgi:hypothetical protein
VTGGRSRPAIIAAMTIAAILAVGFLLSGASVLEHRLAGGLPVGNALSAACLILPAWAAALLAPKDTRIRQFSVAALVLAVLWLPVSIALAGNLDLNFDDSTGTAWFVLTVVAFLASFGSLLAAFASSLRRKRRVSPDP